MAVPQSQQSGKLDALAEFQNEMFASKERVGSIKGFLERAFRRLNFEALLFDVRSLRWGRGAASPRQRRRRMRMSCMILAVVLAGVVSVPAAIAQHKESDVSTAPSAQNSGAGIAGQPGGKSGPAAKSGTVGSSSSSNQGNSAVQQQDAAKIPGMPGNKSGPSQKPSRR